MQLITYIRGMTFYKLIAIGFIYHLNLFKYLNVNKLNTKLSTYINKSTR